MNTYIVLFRGINVGGKNILPMKELTAILERLGCKNIRTYIQSGNVVLETGNKNTAQLSKNISAEINKLHRFTPAIQILTLKELEKIVENNPFPEAVNDPKTLHIGFLDSIPKNPGLQKLESLKTATENFQLTDKAFYLHAPEGIGRSKLAANSERLLGVSMTDRNWRTVCKIMEMAEG
ncbi:MAG: DUF1697 domain-containing protein [Ignavibacteriales bacterium]|nr:MAG: DUF1697 domain-containing protein [Ignavibacteriales bacterium]